MQYALPQFTDVEDKLIGPLTLKQFLIFLATGGIVMFFYSMLQLSVYFFFLAAPVAFIGLGMAFGKFNGRPVYSYVGIFANFLSKPQARIFKREEPTVFIQKEKTEMTNNKLQMTKQEPAESRLRKLAYLLDQKTHEEEQLINK